MRSTIDKRILKCLQLMLLMPLMPLMPLNLIRRLVHLNLNLMLFHNNNNNNTQQRAMQKTASRKTSRRILKEALICLRTCMAKALEAMAAAMCPRDRLISRTCDPHHLCRLLRALRRRRRLSA